MERLQWVGLVLVAVLLAAAAAHGADVPRASLPPQVVQDIQALRDEKAARSPAQRKIGSRLLYATRMRRGVPIARGITALRTGVQVAKDGTTLVDLRAEVSAAVLKRIGDLGGAVVNSFPEYNAIRAHIPVAQAEVLAELPEVRSIRPADRAITHKDTSEGDEAHRADQLRSIFGVDGTGVSVGVLSDGVDSLASLQGSGDLPSVVTVLPGQAGSDSEGTAMLEIVYDLAPAADLFFATAYGGQAQFAANIIALRDAGADLIVDDVCYFAEAVFQDGVVADAVNTVTQSSVLYFSSAGNAGNLNDGTSGVWEGDFADSGTIIKGDAAHDFGGGVIGNEITVDSPYYFTLHWSDASGSSANDYDLYLYDDTLTTLIASSTDTQNGNDDPYEEISSYDRDDTGARLVIVRSAGSDRYLHLNTNRGRLAVATAGQTSGHSAARDAFSVAAVRASRAPFDPTDPVETFSSDGPRRVFYEADGTAITPGDFSSTGGEVRLKPDLTAADCVTTATPGFNPFCGTSAAAPHAAAIAALLTELGGGAPPSPAQIRELLVTTAIDIEDPDWDRDSGAGIVDALEAGDALPVCGNGELEAGEACDDGNSDDGDCCSSSCEVGPAGTECRPSAGMCDIAEFCDGISGDCPTDLFEPDTLECRASVGVCDATDYCDGASATCPVDAKLTSECRAGEDCDAAELCNGLGDDCPEDDVEPPTTVCRAAVGVCDAPDYCDGVGVVCTADEKLTTECRAAADVCDIAEVCNGVSDDCPTDLFEPDTLECRASAGVCDIAETCTGTGAACPRDVVEPVTTECRAAVGVCDVAERCSGWGDHCGDDVVLDAVPCPDADVCNGDEMCVVGVCTSGALLSCEDHDLCTVDSCDAVSGCANTLIQTCVHAPTLGGWGQGLLIGLLAAAGALLATMRSRCLG